MKRRLEDLVAKLSERRQEVAEELRYALAEGDLQRVAHGEQTMLWLSDIANDITDLQYCYYTFALDKRSELEQWAAKLIMNARFGKSAKPAVRRQAAAAGGQL